MKDIKGKLIEATVFEKEIKYIRCHAILMKDEDGQVIYTFKTKEKADEFFEALNN